MSKDLVRREPRLLEQIIGDLDVSSLILQSENPVYGKYVNMAFDYLPLGIGYCSLIQMMSFPKLERSKKKQKRLLKTNLKIAHDTNNYTAYILSCKAVRS